MRARLMRCLVGVVMLVSVISFSKIAARAAGDVTQIKYGDIVQGEITNTTSQIAYKFTGKKGDIAILLMQAPSSDTAPNNLIPAIRVQDTDGKSLADTNSAQTILYIPVPGVQVAADLPADGDYTIIATHLRSDNNVGKFTLTLTQAPLLEAGKAVSGTVKATQNDAFYAIYAIRSSNPIGITYVRKTGDYGPEVSIQAIESESGIFVPQAHLTGDQLELGSLAIKGGGKLYLVTLEGSDYDQRTSTYEITLISTQ
jgi:hypothetical protein